MKRESILIPAVLTLGVFGCATLPPQPIDTVTPILSGGRLYYDDGPAIQDSLRLIVRDLTTWRDVWAQATSSQASPPPRPALDFTREMAIVVGAGPMSPGDQVRVDSAGVRQNRYVVVVSTVLECDRFSGEAYPLEIVRVPRESGPIEWVSRRGRASHCLEGR